LPKSGRLRETGKVDAVHALLAGEEYLFQKKIAQMLDIHHETIKRMLRDNLNVHNLNFKRVPRALNNSQKAVRIQVSR
jgi:hypothetical protein